jgi:hypothetical protein
VYKSCGVKSLEKKSYLGTLFTVGDLEAHIRQPANLLKNVPYSRGDALPSGKILGDAKTIPPGTIDRITEPWYWEYRPTDRCRISNRRKLQNKKDFGSRFCLPDQDFVAVDSPTAKDDDLYGTDKTQDSLRAAS